MTKNCSKCLAVVELADDLSPLANTMIRAFGVHCDACLGKLIQKRTARRSKTKPSYVGDIRCACGARWEGKYALFSPVIESHRQRERNNHKLGCRVTVIVEPRQLTEKADR